MFKPVHLDNKTRALLEVRDLRTYERPLKNAMAM